jgi:hypothetical protein
MNGQDIYKFVNSELSNLSESVESIKLGSFNLQLWIPIFRLVGYCLLVLSLFDIIEQFIPPGFMNPAWEFKTMGMLVERTPVPLLGFMLVFAGGLDWRNKWELILLKFLSWLTLIVGILYLLLIPVGVMNTIRLNQASTAQIDLQSNQQTAQASEFEKQVNQATPEQLVNVLRQQGQQVDGKNPQEVKSQVLSQVAQAKDRIKTQATDNIASRRLTLLKNSVKWILGALVAGAFFITMWKSSYWAR